MRLASSRGFGLINILFFLILLGGLVFSVYLVGMKTGFLNRAYSGTSSVLPLPLRIVQSLAIVNPGFFQTLSDYDNTLSKTWRFTGSSGTGVYDWQNNQSAAWHYVITLGGQEACVVQDSAANPVFAIPPLFAGKTVKLSGFIRVDPGNSAQGYWQLNVKTGSSWNNNWVPGKTPLISAGTGWQLAEIVAAVPTDATEISVSGCAIGASGAKVNFDSATLVESNPNWVQADNGIVTLNQNGVPHFSSSGQKLTSYQAGSSIFITGMYGVDFGPNGSAWNTWGPTWESLGFQRSDISHDEAPDLKAAGFNFVQNVGFSETDLNYADKMGLKVAVALIPQAVSALNNIGGYNIDSFKADIARIKVHPSILYYHLFDENPEDNAKRRGLPPVGETGWATIYKAIKSADPNRLVVANMAWGNGHNYEGYHSEPGCFSPAFNDFAHFDDYAIQSTMHSIRDFADGVKLAAQSCAGPVLVIQQTFMGDSEWKFMPTVSQLRAQYWASVVDGSTAIVNFLPNRPWFWKPANPKYHWDDPNAIPVGISPEVNSDLWNEAKRNNNLIQTYKNILLSVTATDVYHLFVKRDVAAIPNPSDSPIRAMLKDNGEQNVRYLLALNIDDSRLGGGFSFGRQIVSVKSLFDNRDLSSSRNTFTDDFEAYGVRLYKITFSSSTPLVNLGAPSGTFDVANCSSFVGWVCDPDDFNSPVTVRFYEGTTLVSSGTNGNLSRPDVNKAGYCGSNSNSGFKLSVPASLQNGVSHTISAKAVDITSGQEFELWGNPKMISSCSVVPSPVSTPAPSKTAGYTSITFTCASYGAYSSSSQTINASCQSSGGLLNLAKNNCNSSTQMVGGVSVGTVCRQYGTCPVSYNYSGDCYY